MGRRAVDHVEKQAGAVLVQSGVAKGPWPVCVIDGNCRILNTGTLAEEQLQGSVVGDHCQLLVHAEDRDALQKAISHAWSTGNPVDCEARTPDQAVGSSRQVIRVLPLQDGAAPARALLVIDARGCQRRADAGLRRSPDDLSAHDERLRVVLDAAGAGLWDWDLTTGACHFSPDHLALLGHAPDVLPTTMAGMQLLLHPDDQHLPDAAWRLLRDQGHILLRLRVRAADESYRWLESRGKAVQHNAQGEPLRAMGIHLDITERVRLEATLRHSQAQLRAVAEGTGGTATDPPGIPGDVKTDLLRKEPSRLEDMTQSRELRDLALSASELGTWGADLLTGTVTLDDRYAAMLGYGPGELKPTPQQLAAMVHPEDLPGLRAKVQEHARGETRLCEVEYRLRHKDGYWVWVLDRGKCVRDADGRPVRAAGTTQDISERRQAAAEGAALVKKLEHLIAGLDARPPADAAPLPPGLATLSARSREVLALLAEGLTSAEIGRQLHISPQTASTHRRNLIRQLGVRNRAELIRLAVEHGIAPAARPARG